MFRCARSPGILLMAALLRPFRDSGFLTDHPQDRLVPRALLAVGTNCVVDTGAALQGPRPDFALARIGRLGGWIRTVLAARHDRTLTAVYGSSVLVGLITGRWSYGPGFGPAGAQMATIARAVWFPAILTTIFAHALEWPLLWSALAGLTGSLPRGWLPTTLLLLPAH